MLSVRFTEVNKSDIKIKKLIRLSYYIPISVITYRFQLLHTDFSYYIPISVITYRFQLLHTNFSYYIPISVITYQFWVV